MAFPRYMLAMTPQKMSGFSGSKQRPRCDAVDDQGAEEQRHHGVGGHPQGQQGDEGRLWPRRCWRPPARPPPRSRRCRIAPGASRSVFPLRRPQTRKASVTAPGRIPRKKPDHRAAGIGPIRLESPVLTVRQ